MGASTDLGGPITPHQHRSWSGWALKVVGVILAIVIVSVEASYWHILYTVAFLACFFFAHWADKSGLP